MLNQKLVLGIIIGVTVIGLTLLAFQWWILGGLLTAVGGAFLYVWWRMNQLVGISNAMASGNFDVARQKLAAVKRPEKLNAYSKTYYYFFLGTVEAHGSNMKAARAALKMSLETNRFRAIDEKASALLMLAQVELRSQNKEGAKRLLREARDLSPGDEVRKQINQIVQMARLRI